MDMANGFPFIEYTYKCYGDKVLSRFLVAIYE
jgi:hypothetical protein